MTIEHPDYWLAYLSETTEQAPEEITAIAPEVLPRQLFTRDTRRLLAVDDAYHQAHPWRRVVFAAALTRWLYLRGLTWAAVNVDFHAALEDLDAYAPALLIQASPIARIIVANSSLELTVFVVDDQRYDRPLPVEDVRTAILGALERDWPAYIRQVVDRRAQPAV